MTYCPKCGVENKNGAVFCAKCGNKLNAGFVGASDVNEKNQKKSGDFSFKAFFLWFFVLMKEKMYAAAIISLLIAVVPAGYFITFSFASSDLWSVGYNAGENLREWEGNVSDTAGQAVHNAMNSNPYTGVIDIFAGEDIDNAVDGITGAMIDASGLNSVASRTSEHANKIADKYSAWSTIWGLVTLAALIFIGAFWGRKYSYYLDLHRKGINFLCAIGDPAYRKNI